MLDHRGGAGFDGFDSQCAFGVVLFARPDIGAVTLALLFGLFSLISGVTLVTRGVEIRRTGKSLHSVLPKAA
jgi:hypothetical protein